MYLVVHLDVELNLLARQRSHPAGSCMLASSRARGAGQQGKVAEYTYLINMLAAKRCRRVGRGWRGFGGERRSGGQLAARLMMTEQEVVACGSGGWWGWVYELRAAGWSCLLSTAAQTNDISNACIHSKASSCTK